MNDEEREAEIQRLKDEIVRLEKGRTLSDEEGKRLDRLWFKVSELLNEIKKLPEGNWELPSNSGVLISKESLIFSLKDQVERLANTRERGLTPE